MGPDRFGRALGNQLDDGNHYFVHVSPAGMDPIAGVVVGPGGIWALTFTSESGRFRKRNEHWYRWNRSTDSWVPWTAEPILTARLAAHRLGLYLERAALPSDVAAGLVIGRDTEIDWERDQRSGVEVYSTADQLAVRLKHEVLTLPQIDRIVALLDPRQPLPRLAASTPHG